MPGLLEYALRADALQMGLLGRLGAFLAERQDFANNRMQQLRESEWRPWEWDYDTRATEMRGLLAWPDARAASVSAGSSQARSPALGR